MNSKYALRTPEDVSQTLLNEFLVQLTLGDEWIRVFLDEKRVGLGVLIVLFYCVGKNVILLRELPLF